ncbi:MAG: ABC transporter permease [Spirochaetaceae bacterium]|nr:MAG: ABC transporter permease [Spirochaetaceae bacterium]
MGTLKLYMRFIQAYLKIKMEYRFPFFMDFFTHIVGYGLTYAGIWIIMTRFPVIRGWTFDEVVFLFSLNLLSYGISGIFFFTPLRRLESLVRDGSFDNLLIKPMNPFAHLVVRYFNHDFFGHVIIAVIFLAASAANLRIAWTPGAIFMLVLFVIGAVLIQAGLMILSAAICFWFFTDNASIDMVIYGTRRFIDFPVTVYDRGIQMILTFAIPYAFVNFYPAVYFIGEGKEIPFSPLLAAASPMAGIIVFAAAILAWNIGIRRYQSTGT